MEKKQDIIKIACGSDDKIHFTKEHFGSAKYFLIYELNLNNLKINKIKQIKNNSVEEQIHGDPQKAKSVSQILNDVNILVGYVMGPNITRMRKKFIIVVSRVENIERSLNLLKQNINKIKLNLFKQDSIDKNIIYLDKK